VPKQIEVLELAAVNQVLQRLGEEMYDLLKFHLNRYYHIKLDESAHLSCTLEELSNALQKLIGMGATELLVQDIYLEIDTLSSRQ
jgi:hypothetical protein